MWVGTVTALILLAASTVAIIKFARSDSAGVGSPGGALTEPVHLARTSDRWCRHQPEGLFDHDRTSAGLQSSPTRTSTSGRSPGG